MDEQFVPLETQQEEPQPDEEKPAASEVVVSELEDDEWQD